MVGRAPRPKIRTEALIVRRVPVGEADWMLGVFTPSHGLLSASARSARRASSRLGVLEPLHALELELELSPGDEIAKVRGSRILRARLGLLADAERLDEAAHVLRWVRATVGAGTSEPVAFRVVSEALDALDRGEHPSSVVVRAGVRLLSALGYTLELERCTSCGRACPDTASALIDPSAGGLVCRACGGGPLLVSARVRTALRGLDGSDVAPLAPEVLSAGARLVDDALAAHAARAETRRRV